MGPTLEGKREGGNWDDDKETGETGGCCQGVGHWRFRGEKCVQMLSKVKANILVDKIEGKFPRVKGHEARVCMAVHMACDIV